MNYRNKWYAHITHQRLDREFERVIVPSESTSGT